MERIESIELVIHGLEGQNMFDVASIEETKQTFGNDIKIALYDEFVEETADENGEVDNNYYQIWLKERLSR